MSRNRRSFVWRRFLQRRRGRYSRSGTVHGVDRVRPRRARRSRCGGVGEFDEAQRSGRDSPLRRRERLRFDAGHDERGRRGRVEAETFLGRVEVADGELERLVVDDLAVDEARKAGRGPGR